MSIVICPNCKKTAVNELPAVTDEATFSTYWCSSCYHEFLVCPRCKGVMVVEPLDLADSPTAVCPVCEKSLVLLPCPKCDQKIWNDLKKCSDCATRLAVTFCPVCQDKIFKDKKVEHCPKCETYFSNRCPRCYRPLSSKDFDKNCNGKCPDCGKKYTVEDTYTLTLMTDEEALAKSE